MRIAVVFPAKWFARNPAKTSVDFENYLIAITHLGHEAFMFCRAGSEHQGIPNVIEATASQLEDRDFWHSHRLDLAIVFTWFNHPKLAFAIQSAGTFVVARGDSDGLLSVRLNPMSFLRTAWGGAKGAWTKVKTLRHFTNRWLYHYKRENAQRLTSLAHSDLIVTETVTAADGVKRFIAAEHRPELAERIVVLPHLVSSAVLNDPVSGLTKSDKIIAIGRWDSPQKNGSLLVKALGRFARQRPTTKVCLIGNAGDSLFQNLTSCHRQISYVGSQPRETVLRLMRDARSIVFSSRWEGSPVSGNEMLALGGTVIGTPIPGVIGVVGNGCFGTVARRHTARSLCQAMLSEMTLWDAGHRQPEEIAAHWRPQLSADYFIKTVIDHFQRLS